MIFSSLSSHAAGLLAIAAAALASPAPVGLLDPRVTRPLNELVVRDPMEIARDPNVEKRLKADFCLNHEWNNHVLFGGSWIGVGAHDAAGVALEITCVECWTKGTVAAAVLEDIFNPVVRLDFVGVEAYIDLAITASAGATYSINLFASDCSTGLGFPGLSLGLVFYLDLVFSISAEIDLTGGFYVKIAEGSFLETNVFDGKIVDHLFDGISTKSIPVTVISGSATFKADLRLRVQCGASIDGDEMLIPIPGIGAGADVGIYANLVEFVSILDSTPSCALQTLEYFDLNVGAYANLDVVVDFKTMGVVPTISTTLLNSPTFTQCWVDHSPHETGIITTTATTFAVSGGPPAYPQTLSLDGSSTSLAASGTFSTVIVATITSPAGASATPAGAASSGYVVPGGDSSAPGDDGLVTSTVYSTTVYTITSCAATVVNCPASYQQEIIVTKTVDAYTTVCPATAVVTYPSSSTISTTTPTVALSTAPVVAAVNVVTQVIVLSTCPTPIVDTFVPPSALPTLSQHLVTGSLTGSLTVPAVAAPTVAIEEKIYTNATTSYTKVAQASAGVVTSSPSSSPITAAAGRPLSGGLLAVAGVVAAGVFALM